MNRERGCGPGRPERGQAVVRWALVGQGRRMGSNLKPWGALGCVKQRCGIVQLHEGTLGCVGWTGSWVGTRGQAETAVKRLLQHPGGRLGGLTNGVAVWVERRGSERNLGVKEDDRAW